MAAINRIYDVLGDTRGYSPPRGCVALTPSDVTHQRDDGDWVVDGEIIQGVGTAVETALYSPDFFAYLKSTFAAGIHTPHVVVDNTIAVEIGSANIGDAASATQAGVVPLSIRDDALSTLSDPEGDLVGERTDSTGAKWVRVTSLDTALPSGTNAIGKLAANSGVDIGDVDVTSVVPGTGATNLGKAEDAVHTSGDVGVMMLGVSNEAAAAFAAASNDYTPIAVSKEGYAIVTRRTSGTYLADGTAEAQQFPIEATGNYIVYQPVMAMLWNGTTWDRWRGNTTEPVTITPTLDTSAYAAGDILFNPTEVAAAAVSTAGRVRLVGLSIFDGDAQGAAMDIYVVQASTTFGTINTAPTITDANLDPPNFQHVIGITAGDWKTISGAKVVSWSHDGDGLPCVSAGTSMYLAALTQGAPTHTASGIVITTWWARG